MKQTFKRAARGSRGFSLTEVMATLLIMTLVAALAAPSIQTTLEVYRKTVDAANAQAYLATTMIALRSELSFAVEPEIVDGKTVRYVDPVSGYRNQITSAGDEGGEKSIQITKYLEHPKEATAPLITNGADNDKLFSSYKSVSYNPDSRMFTIKELMVSTPDGYTAAEVADFKIHTVNQ